MRCPRLLAAVASVLLCLALSACGPVASPTWRGIIKFGVVAPYSGAAPADGLSLLAGARLAADDLNRAGGVGGYRLEIVAPDEANPSSPRDLAVDPDVIGVVGHLGPDGRAASDVYREAGLAWLAAEPVDPGNGRYPMVSSPGLVDALVAGYLRSRGLPDAEALATVAACRRSEADGGGLVPADALMLACGLSADRLAGVIDVVPPGSEVICIDGCPGPDVSRWTGNVALDAVVPIAPPDAEAAAWDRLAQRLRDRVTVTVYAGVGYDGVQLLAAAAGRAGRSGVPTRRRVAEELGQTNDVGVLGSYGPTGIRRVAAQVWEPGGRLAASRVEER